MTSAQKKAFIKLHGLEDYNTVEFMDYVKINKQRKVDPVKYYNGIKLMNHKTNMVQTPEGFMSFTNKVTGFVCYPTMNNETQIARNTGYGVSYACQTMLGAKRCKEKMVTMFIKGGAEIMFFITQVGVLSNNDAHKLAYDALSQTSADIQAMFHEQPCEVDYVATQHGPLGFLGSN